MRVWDTPYEAVMQARHARGVIQRFVGISDTDLAFMKISADPRWLQYQNAVKYLREYEQKYYK